MTTFAPAPDVSPSGVIQTVFGTTADVPEGWVVCDGNNGTPDLRDKYVQGTTSSSSLPGSEGGSNSVTLSTPQLPSHGHGGSTDSAGSHSHTYDYNSDPSQDVDNFIAENVVAERGDGDSTVSSSANGGHSHTMSVNTAGSGNSIDNRPQYTEILFIKRL